MLACKMKANYLKVAAASSRSMVIYKLIDAGVSYLTVLYLLLLSSAKQLINDTTKKVVVRIKCGDTMMVQATKC